MAGTVGVTFAIGAALSPTVASVFGTVQQRIRASQQEMQQLTAKSRILAEADSARRSLLQTQKLYAAGGGRDPMLREALEQQVAAYHKAARAAAQYGVSAADIAKAHVNVDRALAATRVKLEALQKAEAWKEKRQEAAASMRSAAVPALALAAPVREAINFESAMADAAKTIDGMRDETGKLTAKYYAMEAAVKQMGQTLPLTHDEIARLFAAGGQQGMAGINELSEFTVLAAQMAVAFDMGTEKAAEAIGGYRSALNLTMPEARSLLDLMNQYANTTSASEKGIADVVRRIGSLGSVGGIAAKPMTALAATLDAMKVAPEVAATGIKALFYSGPDHPFERQDQRNESDISFLNRIALDRGCHCKVHNGKLAIFDAEQAEAAGPSLVIPKKENMYSPARYSFKVSSSQTAYSGANAAYTDPKTGTTHLAEVKSGKKKQDGGAKNLTLQTRVESAGQAITLGRAKLHDENMKEETVNLEIMGCPKIAAGQTLELADFGTFSGIYSVKSATHKVGGAGGYTTSLELTAPAPTAGVSAHDKV